MLPKMVYLERALLAPELHFNQLRTLEPVMEGSLPIIRRTHLVAESEIVFEGKRYMLYMPLKERIADKIEKVERLLERISAPFICRNRVLHNELRYTDIFGNISRCDIIIQELPDGIPFRDALSTYSPPSLLYALKALRNDMESVGFTHNDLTPSSLIIDKESELHLLRYWYAEIGNGCNDDFSKLERLVHSECMYKMEHASTTTSANNPIRRYRNKRFGFEDDAGNTIIPYDYSWASDFNEGRAIVAIEGLMGIIAPQGDIVIPIEYNDIEFDSRRNIFICYKEESRHLMSYNGAIIEE